MTTLPSVLLLFIFFTFFTPISSQVEKCDTVDRNADRRPDPTRLKITSFNAYWLFLTNWRTGIDPDGPWSTLKAAQAHGTAIAARLDAIDADVIALLETEDCATVQLVRAQMRSAASYKVFFVPGFDSATGQNVVLLSRVDPDGPVWRSDERLPYPVSGNKCGYRGSSSTTTVSKNLLARLAVPGFPLILLAVAHLIARPTAPDRCAQREAQALVMKSAIKAALKETPTAAVLVMGDLNDLDDKIPDADDADTPNSRVLSTIKSSTTPRLKSTWEFVDAADRWSTCSPNCRTPICSAIDYVLVSDKLLAIAEDVGSDVRGRNRTCPEETGPSPSDHWPVSIVLRSARSPTARTTTNAGSATPTVTTKESSTIADGTTRRTTTARTTRSPGTTEQTTVPPATDWYETLIGQALLPPTCADIGTCGECTTSPLLSCQWCKSNGTDGGESRCAEPSEPCGVQDALLTEDECALVNPFTCFTVNQILHSCRSCVDSLLNCSWCPARRMCVERNSGDMCATALAADAGQCRALAVSSKAPTIFVTPDEPAGDAFPTWAIAVIVVLVAIIMFFIVVKLVLVFRSNQKLQRRRELQRWAQDTGAQPIHMVPANAPAATVPFLGAPASPAQSPPASPPASPRGPPPAKPPMRRASPPPVSTPLALPPLRARPMPTLVAPSSGGAPAALPSLTVRPMPKGPRPAADRCRALYDFVGSSPDDLTFRAGDEIRLLDTSQEWWRGELNGRVGMLPNNFVEKI